MKALDDGETERPACIESISLHTRHRMSNHRHLSTSFTGRLGNKKTISGRGREV